MSVTTLGRNELCACIPHSGRMCLLDSVVSWHNEQIICLAGSHKDPHNPLRNGQGLAIVHGLEYAAQAMAVHGRLLAQAATAKAGLLASVRAVRFFAVDLHSQDSPLEIWAERISGDEKGILYHFSLRVKAQNMPQKKILLAGRAAVLFPEPHR